MYFLHSVYIRSKLYQKCSFISIFGRVRGINVSNIPSNCVQVEQATLWDIFLKFTQFFSFISNLAFFLNQDSAENKLGQPALKVHILRVYLRHLCL